MRALPEHQRTDNIATDYRTRGRCGACGDSGWAEVAYRTDTYRGNSATVEEYAPCPFCLRGLGHEFPSPEWLKKPEAIQTPWGQDGYWQGREIPDELVELSRARESQAPLPLAVQRSNLNALLSSVGFRSVDAEIEPRGPFTRRPLVTNEKADW